MSKTITSVSSRYYHNILLILIIIGLLPLFWVRFTRLSTAPPGFFTDEASIGYNAFSILKTGKDEHNQTMPIYFEAFGEYKNPVFIYSAIPFIKLLGLTINSVRLTAAFWGVAFILIFTYFIHQLFKNLTTSLFSLALALTNPWLFQLSRIGFEVITYPVLLITSIFFIHRFTITKKFNYFLLFVLSLGISFYTYTSGRLLSVLFLIVGLWIYRKHFKVPHFFIISILFFLTLVPAILWESYHPGSLSSRFNIVSIFNYIHFSPKLILTIIWQYLEHFFPRFLFLTGDGNLRHSPGFHSLFFWISGPLLIFGFNSFFRSYKSPFIRFLLLAFFLSPIPSALTIQSPHALRAIALLPIALIIISTGFHQLAKINSNTKIILLIMLLFFLETISFYLDYFKFYPKQAEIWFESDTVSSMQFMLTKRSPYYLSADLYPGSYITFLFLRRYSPAQYLIDHQSDTHEIDFTHQSFFAPGTYLLDYDTCKNQGLNFSLMGRLLYHNYTTCVYEL
jgi:4-amino-4-deoxy-L-arabinose transferase-like glycosyltransferase